MCLQQILLCQPTYDWKAHEFNIHVSDCLRSMLRQHNVNNWSHLVFNHPVSGLDCTQKKSRVQVCDKSEFINNWTGVRVAQPLSWFVNGIKLSELTVLQRDSDVMISTEWQSVMGFSHRDVCSEQCPVWFHHVEHHLSHDLHLHSWVYSRPPSHQHCPRQTRPPLLHSHLYSEAVFYPMTGRWMEHIKIHTALTLML